MATEANRINCFVGDVVDSVNTKNLVIKKLTSTPKKNEMANESAMLLSVNEKK